MVDSSDVPFVVPEAREYDDEEVRKSSTINSMFVGTTISKPNVDSIILAVATILHSQMLEVILITMPGLRTRQGYTLRERTLLLL